MLPKKQSKENAKKEERKIKVWCLAVFKEVLNDKQKTKKNPKKNLPEGTGLGGNRKR